MIYALYGGSKLYVEFDASRVSHFSPNFNVSRFQFSRIEHNYILQNQEISSLSQKNPGIL